MISLKKVIKFEIAVLCIVVFFAVWINLCIKSRNSGYCGAKGNRHNVRWEFDEEETLTISGTGEMESLNFANGNVKWHKALKNDIRRVVIEDGVTSIGGWAFVSCSEISEVVIPDSVTSIGDSAFANCTNLTEIEPVHISVDIIRKI